MGYHSVIVDQLLAVCFSVIIITGTVTVAGLKHFTFIIMKQQDI